MRVLSVFLLLILLAISARPALAAGEPAVAPSVEPVELDLNTHLEYLEDPQHVLNLDDVRQTGHQWTVNGSSAFNRGFNDSSWWLRLRLTNPSANPQLRLLEIGYAVLDHIQIYVLEDDKLLQQWSLGDKQPYSQRPVDHRYFLVPMTWEPDQTLDIYLHISTSGAVKAPLVLWSYQRFHSVDFVNTLVQGFYYGGMTSIALYNLLIFFVLRDRNYLFYVAFIISTVMTLASQSGLAFRFLWPEATVWNDLAIIFFTSSTAAFAVVFSLRFLRIDSLSRNLAIAMRIALTLSVALIVASFTIPYHWAAMIVLVNVLITIVVVLVAGVFALRSQVPSARIFMLAWTILLLGAMVVVLSHLGVLPVNVLTEYSTHLGSMLEAVLLSLALAQRINAERRLRFQAQADALQASQRANAELEQRVQLRTAELEQLNIRLQQLSETDPLTGLANRRFLEHRLRQEWARCSRQQRPLAIVLLDVDFFKQVNDRFGHPAGDACLQQVAGTVQGGLRWPADVAARYGGEEFCLLLPETDSAGAMAVAERVRKQVASASLQTGGKEFSVTISVGIYAGLPEANATPEDFIRLADAALYQSKQSGRNQVTVAG
ncbi:MAG: diguanylate cyclase [Pseudomonadota bacterium]|nr:diguanylate cyclase [Pseudomonadota bacterium]